MKHDGKVIAVAVYAVRYNTHTRPREIHFREESDGFIYAYRMSGDCNVYDRSYGTIVDAIGDHYMQNNKCNDSHSWSITNDDSASWYSRENKDVTCFFVSPALACPQCGHLSDYDNLTEKIDELQRLIRKESCGHVLDMGYDYVDKLMPFNFINVLSWLIRNDKRHAILLRRCENCRKKYKSLYDHVIERTSDRGTWYRTKLDTSKHDHAKKFLTSIGKKTRWIGDETQRKAAIKSIRRRLRRKMKGLSKSELQFFRMIAGAAVIKTMGGKNGSNYQKQDR